MRHQPVLRGGSWNNNDNNCRVANRNNNNPDNSNNNNGVRVVNAIIQNRQAVLENGTLVAQKTTSQPKPEPAEGISAWCATKIAHFHILAQKRRMIVRRLVGCKPRKP